MSSEIPIDGLIAYFLKRAQAGLRAEMDKRLGPQGLTTPQYAALSALESRPGASSAELARRSFVTPQTMIRIVAGLEQRGLVTRREHPSHGRILEATLTAEGQRAVSACHAMVRGIERRMLSALTKAERHTLTRLLKACADALMKDD